MAIPDNEVREIIRHAAQIRSSSDYRNATRTIRTATIIDLSNVQRGTDLYFAIRLQIGVWEHLSIAATKLSVGQTHELFKSLPIALMWTRLQPAVIKIRTEPDIGPNYAKHFQELAETGYTDWVRTEEGQRFTTENPQAIFAMFG
jgi:hypothetical protein